MTKHIYRIATDAQEQLLGAAMLHPADEWVRQAPRVQADAWATLWRWHHIGEPILRISEEMEAALLDAPMDPATPLATALITHEALACQMPDRRQWIVVARHIPAPAYIPLHGEHGWAYAQPVVTYCGSSAVGSESGYTSGFINLIDQPTAADLRLTAGTITAMVTEETRALTDADIASDDFRLSLALALLFRPRGLSV